jgi:uncharacterized protein (DUF1501 family)
MFDRVYTSRRSFLKDGFTLLSAASTLPVFLGRTARVLAQSEPAGKAGGADQRILVVVQLAGGNDGLNTVIPVEMDAYYKHRRRLAIPRKDALKLEGGVALHPAATGLKALFDAGRMAVIQGVGYPNPNRSHFSSMDIWHTADPELRKHEGWLGRYFDACCKGDDPTPEPIRGVALMSEAPLALQGVRFSPLAFQNTEALNWNAARRDPQAAEAFRKLNNADGDLPAGRPGADPDLGAYVQRAALKALLGADEIRQAAGTGGSVGRRLGRRGDEVSRALQLVTRMIRADLPTRMYYVSMGGFDTHTGQEARHRALLEQLGQAMQGFIEALEQDKLLDRVLVMSFSEFGRRVQENASGGTDHGEAAPMFLFGSCVRPGVHEKHPSLEQLHRGDLAFGVDFRRVYATVLRDWLKTNPQPILGGTFQSLRLLRA